MKIAVPSTRPDLEGTVANRLGTCDYLLVIETDDLSFEAVENPSSPFGTGGGIQAVTVVLNLGAKTILVGYMAPHIVSALAKQGVEVVCQASGTVAEALNSYITARISNSGPEQDEPPAGSMFQDQWVAAFGSAVHQLQSFLPRLVGVILLLGLLYGFVPVKTLLGLFVGTVPYDSFWGACLGSILAGNPVNSYVIGKSLLDAGVGIAGIAALMLAWVNVGLIQLPAESEALGIRFALARNFAGFITAMGLSFVVMWAVGSL